jgi:hypothetical protein
MYSERIAQLLLQATEQILLGRINIETRGQAGQFTHSVSHETSCELLEFSRGLSVARCCSRNNVSRKQWEVARRFHLEDKSV